MKRIIVVTNDGRFGRSVRHVITSDDFTDIETFKEWYYKEYNKLDGDSFFVCETMPIAMEYAKNIGKVE